MVTKATAAWSIEDWVIPLYSLFYPLTPKWLASNFSFYITSESHSKVMRLMEMIISKGSSSLSNKLSLSALEEIYKEEYREYAYWYCDVKGKMSCILENILITFVLCKVFLNLKVKMIQAYDMFEITHFLLSIHWFSWLTSQSVLRY